MSKKDKKSKPAMIESDDPFVELEDWTIRYSDIRAFFPHKDEAGNRTGKTILCIKSFVHPIVLEMTPEEAKALLLPQ